MEYNNVEYVQDIAFNDICDKMVIATSSRKIIIYKTLNVLLQYRKWNGFHY